MKTKQFFKKMTLKKITISNLTPEVQSKVMGKHIPTWDGPSCPYGFTCKLYTCRCD